MGSYPGRAAARPPRRRPESAPWTAPLKGPPAPLDRNSVNEESDTSPDTPPDVPAVAWWAEQRLRLPLLLLSLGVAILALLGSRTSVLSAFGIDSSGGARGSSGWCAPSGLPAVANVEVGPLVELRAAVAAATPPDSRRYAGGVVAPPDVWSDDGPERPLQARSSSGSWPAAYEMRWWTPRYDIAADALLFPDARHARAFFDLAAGTRCHRSGAPWPLSFPPQVRGLHWVNPDGASQEDLFLLRGTRVYRLSAVRLARTPRVSLRVDFEVAQALACRLPAAGCGRSALLV